MIFLIYIQNLTTIDPAVSEITCLIKIDTDTRQIGRRKRETTFFVSSVGIMKRQENIKMAIRLLDSITTSLAYASGSKNPWLSLTVFFIALALLQYYKDGSD